MGTAYLLDTSACSKYIQGLLNADTIIWIKEILSQESLMSVIVRMELLSWVTGSTAIESDVRLFIAGSTVLPLTEPIIQQTVRIRRQHRVKLPDAIIAATAMVYDLTLLSTNDSDFEKITGLNYQSLNA
jgi:predicted nucleic acid-binding protein